MTYHLNMIAQLQGFLACGEGNLDAIAARIGFHRTQLAKRGGFVL
jgi:hypothetical protein